MLRIRLRRMGTRNRPFYRVVVSDARKTPIASAEEEIGYYDPRPRPSAIAIDRSRADYWLRRGAQPSKTVARLLGKPNTVAPSAAVAEA